MEWWTYLQRRSVTVMTPVDTTTRTVSTRSLLSCSCRPATLTAAGILFPASGSPESARSSAPETSDDKDGMKNQRHQKLTGQRLDASIVDSAESFGPAGFALFRHKNSLLIEQRCKIALQSAYSNTVMCTISAGSLLSYNNVPGQILNFAYRSPKAD
jgi:hypothetical protein